MIISRLIAQAFGAEQNSAYRLTGTIKISKQLASMFLFLIAYFLSLDLDSW